MNIHKNAPQTPRSREAMVRVVVDDGLSGAVVARQFRTTPKTVAKWVKRYPRRRPQMTFANETASQNTTEFGMDVCLLSSQ